MPEMVEVVIDSIRVSLMSQQRIVILREAEADRYLAIWIGPYEAEAITIALQDVEVQRPLTHDLLKGVFQALNARIIRVEVISLRNDVYFGNIVAELNGYTLDIDARPSDALALAVRAHVPILVSKEVMELAAIHPEEDLSEEAASLESSPPPESGVEGETSEERLSVFEDFFEEMDEGDGEDDDSQPTGNGGDKSG